MTIGGFYLYFLSVSSNGIRVVAVRGFHFASDRLSLGGFLLGSVLCVASR